MPQVRAYLDTCIVSGLVRNQLSPTEEAAILNILKAKKAGQIDLVTSEVAKTEMERTPDPHHRALHVVVYSLLADVPAARTYKITSGLSLIGVPGARRREDPLFAELRSTLRDRADAEHVFQAAKNNVGFLITRDRRTLISRSAAVAKLCKVQVVTPADFEHAALSQGDG